MSVDQPEAIVSLMTIHGSVQISNSILPRIRRSAAALAATALLAPVGAASTVEAGGVDYTPTCGITTAPWGTSGYQASNDNRCQSVQARVLVSVNGTLTWHVALPHVAVSRVNVVGAGPRIDGGGRGKYSGVWGVWVY